MDKDGSLSQTVGVRVGKLWGRLEALSYRRGSPHYTIFYCIVPAKPGQRSRKGIQPRMNTDGHGWKQGLWKPEKVHQSASQVSSAFLLPIPSVRIRVRPWFNQRFPNQRRRLPSASQPQGGNPTEPSIKRPHALKQTSA